MGCGSSVAVPASTTRPRALSCEESVDEVYASRAKYKPIVWQAELPSTNNTEEDQDNNYTIAKSNEEAKRENEEYSGKDETPSSDQAPLLTIEKSRSIREEEEETTERENGKKNTSSLPPIKNALPKPQKSESYDSYMQGGLPSDRSQQLLQPRMADPFIQSVSPRIPAPHVPQLFKRAQSSSSLTHLTPLSSTPPAAPAPIDSPVQSSLSLSSSSGTNLTRSTGSSRGPPATPTFIPPSPGSKRRSQSLSSSASPRSSSSSLTLAPISTTAAFNSPSKHLPSPTASSLHPSNNLSYDRLSSLPNNSLIPSPSTAFISKSATLNLHVQTQDPATHRLTRSLAAQSPALPPPVLKRELPRKLSEPVIPHFYPKRETPLPSPISPSVIIPDMTLESPTESPDSPNSQNEPNTTGITTKPTAPTATTAPTTPPASSAPTAPSASSAPTAPSASSAPTAPSASSAPAPSASSAPAVPTAPDSNTPKPNAPNSPSLPTIQEPNKPNETNESPMQKAPSGLSEAMVKLQQLLDQKKTLQMELIEPGIMRRETT